MKQMIFSPFIAPCYYLERVSRLQEERWDSDWGWHSPCVEETELGGHRDQGSYSLPGRVLERRDPRKERTPEIFGCALQVSSWVQIITCEITRDHTCDKTTKDNRKNHPKRNHPEAHTGPRIIPAHHPKLEHFVIIG